MGHLEVVKAEIAKGGVTTLPIVPYLDVLNDVGACIGCVGSFRRPNMILSSSPLVIHDANPCGLLRLTAIGDQASNKIDH
jgi:hypothetical protein